MLQSTILLPDFLDGWTNIMMHLSNETYSIEKAPILNSLCKSLWDINLALYDKAVNQPRYFDSPSIRYFFENMAYYSNNILAQCNELNGCVDYLNTEPKFDVYQWKWRFSIEWSLRLENHMYWAHDCLNSKMWEVLSSCKPGPFHQHLLTKLTNAPSSFIEGLDLPNFRPRLFPELEGKVSRILSTPSVLDTFRGPTSELPAPSVLEALDLAKSKASSSDMGERLALETSRMSGLDLASTKAHLRRNV